MSIVDARRGADVKAIEQQFGHRIVSVTLDTYTHLLEGELGGVMERLNLASAKKSVPRGEVVDLPSR